MRGVLADEFPPTAGPGTVATVAVGSAPATVVTTTGVSSTVVVGALLEGFTSTGVGELSTGPNPRRSIPLSVANARPPSAVVIAVLTLRAMAVRRSM